MWNAVDTWRIKIRRDRTSSLSITRDIYTDMYTPCFIRHIRRIGPQLSEHVSNCISLRTNSSAPIPQDSQYFHAQRHVLLVRAPLILGLTLFYILCISIDRGFHLICQPSRYTLSLSPFPLSTDSFKINTCKPRIFTCSYNYRRSI